MTYLEKNLKKNLGFIYIICFIICLKVFYENEKK